MPAVSQAKYVYCLGLRSYIPQDICVIVLLSPSFYCPCQNIYKFPQYLLHDSILNEIIQIKILLEFNLFCLCSKCPSYAKYFYWVCHVGFKVYLNGSSVYSDDRCIWSSALRVQKGVSRRYCA